MEACSVYVITHVASGRQYVGITRFAVKERWKAHCYGAFVRQCIYPLHSAMREFGEDAFSVECIYDNLTWNQACDYECKLIELLKTHCNFGGFNQTFGGEGIVGWHHTEHAKSAISKAHLGSKRSEKTCANISASLKGKFAGEKHPLFGKHHSEESRKKMSDSHSKLRKTWKQSSVEQLSLDGIVITTYASVNEAIAATGTGNISGCCRGVQNTANGFRWRYVKQRS